MHIHKLRKTTSGSGYGVSLIGRTGRPQMYSKRTSGSGLVPEIFSNNKIQKSSEVLKNLKISKPRVPKKYITFE
jgi:hypothetical protein